MKLNVLYFISYINIKETCWDIYGYVVEDYPLGSRTEYIV